MTTQHPDALAPAVRPQAPAPETARPPSREGLLRAPVTSAGRGKRHGRRRRHHHHHREHICKYHHHHDHCRRRRCRRRRQRRRRRRRHHHHRARVRCGHSRYAFARPPPPGLLLSGAGSRLVWVLGCVQLVHMPRPAGGVDG